MTRTSRIRPLPHQGNAPREKAKGTRPSFRLSATLLLAAMLLSGLFVGSLLIASSGSSVTSFLETLMKTATTSRATQSFGATFSAAFLSNFYLLLITFLLGFSAISAPVIFLVPLYKGLGLGLSMGYLYMNYGFKGVGYCAFMIVPSAVLSVIAILLGCKESFHFSKIFLHYLFVGPKEAGASALPALRVYAVRFLLLLALVLGAALIESILTLLFGGIFTL